MVDLEHHVVSTRRQALLSRAYSPGARNAEDVSYLWRFLVGDFQCGGSSKHGVPSRAARLRSGRSMPIRADLGGYTIRLYDKLLGSYPLPNVDLIGIPDFEAGERGELSAAITDRESDCWWMRSTAFGGEAEVCLRGGD